MFVIEELIRQHQESPGHPTGAITAARHSTGPASPASSNSSSFRELPEPRAMPRRQRSLFSATMTSVQVTSRLNGTVPRYPPLLPTEKPNTAARRAAASPKLGECHLHTALDNRGMHCCTTAAVPAGRLQTRKLLFLRNPGSNAPSVPRLSPFSLVQPLFLSHILPSIPHTTFLVPIPTPGEAEANATAL